MKKSLILLTIATILLLAQSVSYTAYAYQTTKNYSGVTLNNWGTGNFADVWDLSQGDLTLAYTLDMSHIATAGWSVVEVGIRQIGASNLDPNLLGGWMQSNYIFGGSNPSSRNNNDMHLLSIHGWLYQEYDASGANTLVTPYWSGNNHGFWFDRDGVDPWQAAFWGASGTYSTAGVYTITITFHAIDSTTATMFATINGVQQGLYVGGWKNAQPEFYPAGRSFTGDMTQMQVFYGRGGGGGYVTLSDITVTGFPYWSPVQIDIKPGSDTNPINPKSKGVVPVAVLSSADFDATSILPSTVHFAGADPVRWTIEDVNGDSINDMLFFFNTQELTLPTAPSGTLTLTADTSAPLYLHISGTDTIKIVP